MTAATSSIEHRNSYTQGRITYYILGRDQYGNVVDSTDAARVVATTAFTFSPASTVTQQIDGRYQVYFQASNPGVAIQVSASVGGVAIGAANGAPVWTVNDPLGFADQAVQGPFVEGVVGRGVYTHPLLRST